MEYSAADTSSNDMVFLADPLLLCKCPAKSALSVMCAECAMFSFSLVF